MKKDPTYEELITANAELKQRLSWLEGVYHNHREAGIQVKSRFLSNISHEIRTPMNAILGFSDLLRNNTITDAERDEYIQYISLNSKALLKVMDNIIDLTLLETDNLKVKREEVFAEELFREIYEFYNSKVIRTMNYRVALLMTTPDKQSRVTVKADGYRLHRILDSLVNTAITNQLKGVVEMKMELVKTEKVHLSIFSDKNELLETRAKMIFENNGKSDDWFNQIDSTGMAYKLARDLANAMGGKVDLVQPSNRRMGIRLELPVNSIGVAKKKDPQKRITTMIN
jgi:two-component system sensor histidine kinase EvgS